MYVTWSRILLFISKQETDDKKKGLKRLTAMFYVTSFISPDAEDRKRQHGLRGKIKKYSTQCNTTRLAWGFEMTRLWRPFQANAIRAKPWTWLFTITNKDSGHWKKKNKRTKKKKPVLSGDKKSSITVVSEMQDEFIPFMHVTTHCEQNDGVKISKRT